MKKYLFGMIALTLAIGFSAFTKPTTNKKANVTLFFQGSSYGVTDVQDLSKWSTSFTPSLTCSSSINKDVACRIVISDAFVVSGALDPAYEIVADDLNSNGKYRVASVRKISDQSATGAQPQNADIP